MKLPLGITLILILILQTFHQVSTQIPDDWKRDNMGMDTNETLSSSETPPVQSPVPVGESMQNTQAKSDGSSDNLMFVSNKDEQKQNSTTQYLDNMDNNTEEASSGGPIGTMSPPMIALNSSSDPSETSAESNETQRQDETDTNTSTLEPEHTNQTALNYTYTSPKPESNTTESSLDESGSGYMPSDDVPTNSTTKSPATTTKDESAQYKTTASPTESPVNTTTPEIPPAVPEDQTTPAPYNEGTEANPTGPFDNRDNSERGLSSDVTDATENKKGREWAIVLAVGIVVGIIALAAFIILNRRSRRDFSHRKLVEETSPDPVLRLDNSEPLSFDGFGYYNPGLQGDNIQMTNFPQGRTQ